MAAEARRHGLGVMVGNMVGTQPGHGARLRARASSATSTTSTAPSSSRATAMSAMAFENGKVAYPDRGWGAASLKLTIL